MKATPYVTGGTQRIVLAADRDLPKAEQSVFVVAPLTVDQFYLYMDRQAEGRYKTYLDVIVSQLREAHNFPSDTPVPFPAEGTAEARKLYVAKLGIAGVIALGIAILDQQFVTTDGPEVD